MATEAVRCAAHSPGARFRSELAERYEFDAAELRIVDAVCATLDELDRLEAQVARDGMMTVGHAGQPKLHPGIAEARLQRTTLGRLLAQLELPTEDGGTAVRSLTSLRAEKAARTRWAR